MTFRRLSLFYPFQTKTLSISSSKKKSMSDRKLCDTQKCLLTEFNNLYKVIWTFSFVYRACIIAKQFTELSQDLVYRILKAGQRRHDQTISQ